MKNILSVCAFLLVFGALPLWGQSQDPLMRIKLLYVFWKVIIRILLLSVMEILLSGPFLFYLYSGTGRLPVG